MIADRYRLVTEQDSRAHISSIVLTEDEALDALATEVFLHSITGWNVALLFAETVAEMVIVCRRDDQERTLSVLVSGALEDLHDAL